MTDIIVIGGGPAGMTAALYGLRNGLSVTVIEKNAYGGQITFSPRVENIPGFQEISGNEFADHMMEQIMVQGAQLEFDEVTLLQESQGVFTATTALGAEFTAKAVILANGVKHRMLGLTGEEELIGNGISFCAVCDGDFYTGKKVAVAGGGNSAFVEACLLAEKCSEVIMLQDLPEFTADRKLIDRLFSYPNVKSFLHTRIKSLETDQNGFSGLVIEDKGTKEETKISCDGLFVAIGLIPDNQGFAQFAELDERGYYKAEEDLMTKTPGVFVAGDARAKEVRQVTTACADGAIAALKACEYLRKEQHK